MNCFLLIFIFSFAGTIRCDVYNNMIEDTLSTDTNTTNYLVYRDKLQMQNKVRIDLYYETLCPYCIKFYLQELAPLVQKLVYYIELHTYPFGNAEMIRKDGKTSFVCQHGPEECYGNGLHACAIYYLPKMSEYVPFNACLMRGKSTRKAAKKCGQRLHLDPEPITTCANGTMAIKLLIYYANETNKVNDRDYVPYTIVNDKVMDPNKVLIDTVCAAFKKPPKECKQKATQANNGVLSRHQLYRKNKKKTNVNNSEPGGFIRKKCMTKKMPIN